MGFTAGYARIVPDICGRRAVNSCEIRDASDQEERLRPSRQLQNCNTITIFTPLADGRPSLRSFRLQPEACSFRLQPEVSTRPVPVSVTAPRPTPGKTTLRRVSDDGGVAWGDPRDSHQSSERTGGPGVRVETAAPPIGAPLRRFSNRRHGLAASRRDPDRDPPPVRGLRSFRLQPEVFVASGFSRKSASGGSLSASRRLGLRPEKRRSGGCLTMAGSPGGIRGTATNHLSARVVPASVSKQRRPRSVRLCVVFRTDATGWPHRAAPLTGTRRRGFSRRAAFVASGFSRKLARLQPKSASGGSPSASRRLGLRPEKRRSGGCLTMAGSPGGIRGTDTNHLRARAVPASVPKQRRPRSLRLCVVFRTDATGWPHRAVPLTGTAAGERTP